LASKVEEIYPPKLKDLASYLEGYSSGSQSEEAIAQFELFMLKTLNWEISPVTVNTWLMTYLHIGALNSFFAYSPSLLNSSSSSNNNNSNSNKNDHSPHVVFPLHVLHNRPTAPATLVNQSQSAQMLRNASLVQQQFYLQNYMKAITLLDLCMCDMESLKFSYSILAAAALFHMASLPIVNVSTVGLTDLNGSDRLELVQKLIQKCTGYQLRELDACIRWMSPYAEACKTLITEEKLIQIKYFNNVDPDDAHNIQLYYQNVDLFVSLTENYFNQPIKIHSFIYLFNFLLFCEML
jgi:cyclin E